MTSKNQRLYNIFPIETISKEMYQVWDGFCFRTITF